MNKVKASRGAQAAARFRESPRFCPKGMYSYPALGAVNPRG